MNATKGSRERCEGGLAFAGQLSDNKRTSQSVKAKRGDYSHEASVKQKHALPPFRIYSHPTGNSQPTRTAETTFFAGLSRGESITAVGILTKFYDEQKDDPYPSPNNTEKNTLAKMTGLSIVQVNSWFIRERKKRKSRLAKRDQKKKTISGLDKKYNVGNVCHISTDLSSNEPSQMLMSQRTLVNQRNVSMTSDSPAKIEVANILMTLHQL